jgi:soluble lytic murein transglycosylase-like protein
VRRLINPASVGGSLILVVIAAFAVAATAGSENNSQPQRRTAVVALPAPGVLATGLPRTGSDLAAHIDRAQAIIDDPTSAPGDLARAGLLEQLATRTLIRQTPRARSATLALLGMRARASMRMNVDAATALSRITIPRKNLPDWRIVPPPPPGKLLGYFRAAQSRFGVPWQDLAAIELVETRFGRIRGLSSAGARGPMQFMPGTWARYGSGNIDNQRDAILSAARYLVASGAPGNMAQALYHYNNSLDYVRAVQDYASLMRADVRAYYGYYYWQVIYARLGGAVIMPEGYPKVRPVRLS